MADTASCRNSANVISFVEGIEFVTPHLAIGGSATNREFGRALHAETNISNSAVAIVLFNTIRLADSRRVVC